MYLVHYYWNRFRFYSREDYEGGSFGLLINLLVGIIGISLLGGWIFGLLGIATGGILGESYYAG